MSRNSGHSWGVEFTGLWTALAITAFLPDSLSFRLKRRSAPIWVVTSRWHSFMLYF